MHDKPLAETRVLDLTRLLPGPYATQMLGDLGAEVIKIEEPTVGDYYREMEPQLNDGTSRIFAMLNRNKKSVALNLKDERGKEAFLRLVETADVVVEGFRPGVVERLGIDYETVSERNEAVVYCSLSGYGQSGPYEQWPGHDINYIGIGGLLGMTGTPNEKPVIPGVPVADFAGGMATALAVMVGLVQSKTTGVGSYFDLAMTDVIVSWLSLYAPYVFDEGASVPDRGGTQPAGKYPSYSVYETADGKYIALGGLEYKFWEATCEVLDLEEYANPEDHNPVGERNQEVREAVAAAFKKRTRSEWLEHVDPTRVPIAPVNDLEEIWEDPQVQHRGMKTSMNTKHGQIPAVSTPVRPHGYDSAPHETYPGLGEHSRTILTEVYNDSKLTELFDDGVTKTD
ncbi:CaiB/BaiF CoA transferase family protein [Natrononativus amylolyticus]|uniref:CaiB/BaiF CoA transferase family protein n=1 Tax=Natrononativus amylolyticus TaxID=2963434 RepID=UPI0020CB998F|nr:CaiB/BaiF CoA-transferase family protein [Natrononativus amylolyticus]